MGFSLMEVMVAMAVAGVLTYAISQMLVSSGKQAVAIQSKGDFNSLVNQMQSTFNNTATCLAALTPDPANPDNTFAPADTAIKFPFNAKVSMGGTKLIPGSTYGGASATSKNALKITKLQFEGITTANTSNPNQFIVPLTLEVDRSINGQTAVGGSILTKSFPLIVTLSPQLASPHDKDPRKVIGCAGQYTDLWITTNDTDIVYSGGSVGIGNCDPSKITSPPCVDPPAKGMLLDVNGAVQAKSFMWKSDARLKENIRDIPGALERVLKLHGVLFDWKDKRDPVSKRDQLGFLAQDVEKVFPEAVNTNSDNGMKSVAYANLLAPLIEAFKGQKDVILRQQQEIEELKKAVEKMKQRQGDGT